MIESNGFGFTITCDRCEDDESFGTDTFSETVAWAREQGWKVFKNGDGWQHRCPKCSAPGAEFG